MNHIGIIGIVVGVFVLRLFFLKISKKNEKRILENGGREYGAANSKRMTILHIAVYLFSVIEAFFRKTPFDNIGIAGLALLTFSMMMLYVVVTLLRDIWTVKLMLLKNHKYNPHWLFRTVKHPNYFLNVTPELVGIVLLCHAWFTALIAPFYAYVMYVRIKEEERLLTEVIIPNGTIR